MNHNSSRLKISVVMPTFNEAGALPVVVEDIKKNTAQFDTEILIVDSSTDDTPQIAKALGVKVIIMPPAGHGLALREAITAACGDYIITADCDDTYPMSKIPELIELITATGYDIVSCNRLATPAVKESMPLSNLLANRFFAFVVRTLYRIQTHDVTTGMFAMSRRTAHYLKWETNYSFPAELIIRTSLAGCRYTEIPIDYKIRVGEVTLNKYQSGKAYLRCFLKYRFNLNINSKKL